ncbi:restriction endonuclease type II-like protein [Annulohypoxylon maeteangense]|uniref:restriction endonuclease type II-like protein n=1 Tax=Annulohypoxylon maeteangense TaxID=1927788 RepID=UPI002008648D|nr:restriction endonuclease type II-like protein [Annulohypoxylon maeteangense]KAI0888433.1 restriction endonuclease type II-like protein [Annulohypoxylon maeteangense]
MDDDDFGADADFLSALASSAPSIGNKSSQARSQPTSQPASRIQQPIPQKVQPTPRIQQPAPQRLDKPPPTSSTSTSASASTGPKIVQPTPQALPQRSSGSSILVSPRQKGNPVLASLRSVPWEYSDIPADYGLGLTTCALFLSLKYHRLHPEYIYTRIRNLQGKFNLRILLTMVDIPNHEDSLRELSKTSLINNVTIILCWSAAEAGRYLELYKSYEHANFSAIKGQQATSYAEKLVEFVTVPRGINKADAITLVSAFGSLKNAINADSEQVAIIGGWGEKKVKRWCSVVEEPFRVQHAAKRRIVEREDSNSAADKAIPLSRVPLRDMPSLSASRSRDGATPQSEQRSSASAKLKADHRSGDAPVDEYDEEAMLAAAIEESKKSMAQEQPSGSTSKPREEEKLSDGIAAALARLRDKG